MPFSLQRGIRNEEAGSGGPTHPLEGRGRGRKGEKESGRQSRSRGVGREGRTLGAEIKGREESCDQGEGSTEDEGEGKEERGEAARTGGGAVGGWGWGWGGGAVDVRWDSGS